MTQLTPEYMREWESKLTNRQMDYVMELAIKNGWRHENPPMWVWAQFFREAMDKFPHNSTVTIIHKN